jgi:C_GCAxxG_C_C family probable redox protein
MNMKPYSKSYSSPDKFVTKLEENEEIYNAKGISPGAREKILDIISKSAYNNDRAYEGCTRSVLAALIEHLHLSSCEGAKEVIKASTALAGGVCRMGETCGALTGGIMAIGLATGSEKLEEFDAYKKSMENSYKLYNRFREIYSTTRCFEIQEKVLGRHYDFKKEEDGIAWYKDGGLDKCPMVCATAARLAAEIILDLKESR